MSMIVKVEDSILDFLREHFKEREISGKKISFVKGYLKENNLENQLKGEKDKNKPPFIMIRPGKLRQENKGYPEKTQDFKLVIVIEDQDTEGYRKIVGIGEEIIDLFTETPSIQNGFALVQDEFEGEIVENLCSGDHWVYRVDFRAYLPVKKVQINF